MFKREKVLYEVDTKLEHYQVIDMVYEGRQARVLFSGDRDAAFSGIPFDDNHDLLFDYIQRLFELVATIRPKRLLMIGGGVYTLPTALLHALPDIKIDVVEIDTGLDQIAEAFFGLQHDPRMNIFHQDGKQYLINNTKPYEMIIIDAFTQLQIPKSLAQNDMPQLISRNLTKDGVFAMNIIAAYYGRRAENLHHFYRQYVSTFAAATLYPADVGTSLWQSQNIVLIAQKQQIQMHHGLRFSSLDPLI